jgi:hypothetical protein
MVKQKKLVKEVYQACIDHDDVKLAELRKSEFEKIIKRKEQGRKFNSRWTVVKI